MAKKGLKNVIVIEKDDTKKAYGSLTEICDIHSFPYHRLSRLKYPFEHDGWKFDKVPYRENEGN